MAIEVAPVAMNPMIQSTKLGGISPGEPMAPGGAPPTEPPPESVAEFDRQMSQPMVGNAPASGSDSTGASAVSEYTKAMKKEMGEAAFKEARDQFLGPNFTGTEAQKDDMFASFNLTTVNMAINQMSEDRQKLEQALKE